MMAAGTILLGIVVGSFLNVVVHRVPAGASLAWPASHCPNCGKPILLKDNVPLVSFAVLKGRCRHYAEPIPARYPLVEVMTGLLFVGAAIRFDGPGQLTLSLALVAALISLAVTDLEHRLLPNAIVGPASVAGLVLALWGGPAVWRVYPLAALVVAGLLFGLATVYPGAMGMGDVKMGGMLGLFLGPYAAMAAFVGAFTWMLAYAALVAAGRLERGSASPFGTFMAFGGLVALFAGPQLWGLYLDLLGVS